MRTKICDNKVRDKHEKCFLCGPRRDWVVTCLYNNRGAVLSVLRGPYRGNIWKSNFKAVVVKIRLNTSTPSYRLRPPEAHLTLNGRNIPFVNHVKYLCVISDKRITWRLHLEMIDAKAFRTFIRIYSLLKSERLSAKIKLALHMALIRTVIMYACPAWELAADTYLL
jgi:hypothetical protein